MQKDRRVPAWLARRTYFKRIERWVKPGKVRNTARDTAPPPETGFAAIPSNVVPFPVRVQRPNQPALTGLRGIGMA
ncbi:hypothetical protein ACRBEV_24150 [Methylobacterium phyllosphaerae]